MIVYVATPSQFDRAFALWADQAPDARAARHRRALARVFAAFMASASAQALRNARSGLFSFVAEDAAAALERWRDDEIARNPGHEAAIREWIAELEALLTRGTWGNEFKLLVRECLQDDEAAA